MNTTSRIRQTFFALTSDGNCQYYIDLQIQYADRFTRLFSKIKWMTDTQFIRVIKLYI